MSERVQEPSMVDALLEMIRNTSEVRDVLDRATNEMAVFLAELDGVIASVQDDPSDTGARVARALILRGTCESMLEAAYQQHVGRVSQ